MKNFTVSVILVLSLSCLVGCNLPNRKYSIDGVIDSCTPGFASTPCGIYMTQCKSNKTYACVKVIEDLGEDKNDDNKTF